MAGPALSHETLSSGWLDINGGVSSATRKGEKGSRPRRRNVGTPQQQQRQKLSQSVSSSSRTSSQASGTGFIVQHQIGISLALLASLAATYFAVPTLQPLARKFYGVSYYNESTGLYGKGTDDGYLVFFWIVAFTFLRAAAMDYVFTPFAKTQGISSPKHLLRFAEQAWILVYYSFFWGLGVYLTYHSPYWFNLEHLWTNWPVRELDGVFKWYYLAQFAFWLQQIFVLNIEERRKDHYQMFAHHVITCTLLAASYKCHMTRVGSVILCIMDLVDILLPTAKLLKYMGYRTLCDIAFGVFLLSWVVTRHILYNIVTYSAWKDSARLIPYACFYQDSSVGEPILPENETWALKVTFRFSDDPVCFSKPLRRGFVTFLVALQLITLLWLYMIILVAARVVRGGDAEDTRSDDEEEDDYDVDDSDMELDEAPAPSASHSSLSHS